MKIDRFDQKHTLIEAMHSGINLFVGAGFSVHAKTYADQAIRYYKKYNNDKALNYLKQSQAWLKEEIATSPWAYDLKSYMTKVNDALKIAEINAKDKTNEMLTYN